MPSPLSVNKGGSSDKRKRKAYYRKCAASDKKRKQVDEAEQADSNKTSTQIPKYLKPGLIGYLITCNRQERITQLESFRLLNDSLRRITSAACGAVDTKPESTDHHHHTTSSQDSSSAGEPQPGGGEKEDEDNCDIYSQLLRENEQNNGSGGDRPRYSFYALRTGVANCLFLAHYAYHVTPAEVVHSVFDHLLSTMKPESRHVLRLLPVAGTCHSDAAEVQRSFRLLWADFCRPFSPENTEEKTEESPNHQSTQSPRDRQNEEEDVEAGSNSADPREMKPPAAARQVARPQTVNRDRQPTYMVLFKARNYDRLSRDAAIDSVVSAVSEVSPTWRVSTASPDVVIALNVLRNVTCISLLEDFDTYRKYNVAELISPVSANPEICATEQQT